MKLLLTMPKLNFPEARKYNSNDFLRGSNQELPMAGNSLDVINVSRGCWVSGFRIYVDLELGHAFLISAALVVLSDSNS